jgi:hypothetical protein
MFLFKKLALTALIGASAITALPAEADARDRHHRNSYHGHRDHDRYHDYRSDDRRDYRRDYRRSDYRDRRYYCRRGSGTTGLIIGGAAGALLGREVDRYGDRVPGTIIGGAAGALIGREIDRGGRRC